MQRAAYGRKRFDEMSTKLDKLLLCCEILIQPKKKDLNFSFLLQLLWGSNKSLDEKLCVEKFTYTHYNPLKSLFLQQKGVFF